MRIVVAGAGLGGLAAAIAATSGGHEVTVLERAPELRDAGAGIALLPNAVLALDVLGVGGPVRAQAAPLDAGGGLHDRHGRPLISADQAAVQALAGAPVAVVARTWLQRLLVAQLPAGTARTGVTVQGIEADGDTVRVRSTEGPHVADAVVVADGASSALRAALFPGHPGLAGSGEHAARGIAPTGPAPLSGELLDHRTGERTGCLPMADRRVYWYAAWREAVVGPTPTDVQERQRWLVARRADWHPSIAPLIAATRADDIHVVETSQLARPLPTLAVGRVALLGDAAHAMTPDLGQGAGQALEDAVALGAVLPGTTAAGVADALARYDAHRRPRVNDLQREARRVNRAFGLRGPGARLRDTVLRLVPQAVATRALARQLRFDPGVPVVERDIRVDGS